MPTMTSSTLDSSITTRYTQKFIRAARAKRLYDQLAGNLVGASQYDLESRRGLGSTYTFNFHSDMTPGSTAISESADITPQTILDATSTITPTSRGEAIKWSELLDLEVYTDWIASRAEMMGDNMIETLEVLCIESALAGSLVDRTVARASLDAGTATHNWTEANLWRAAALVQGLRCPALMERQSGMYLAIAHPDAYYDLFHGGNVISAATYGGLPGTLLFNGELGEIANFKLLISPWAKVFGAAGLDHASSMNTGSGYAVSAAADALATTVGVTTATNVGSGRFLTVGTEETSTTFYPQNERVRYVSGTTTTTFVGSGANGGFRFAHTTSDTVYNNDSVYPVAYGTPGSLVKVYANETGEFGELVGPKFDGLANQWQSLAWKWYGGYGRVAENFIMRGEYSSSLDNI